MSNAQKQPSSSSGPSWKTTFKIVLVAAVLIGGLVALTLIRDKILAHHAVETFGENIANMCHNIPPQTPTTIDFSTRRTLSEGYNSSNLKVVLLDYNRVSIHAWQDDLPDDLEAKKADDVDIVVCVQPQKKKEGSSCLYTSGTMHHQYYTLHLVFLNHQTGVMVAEDTILSKDWDRSDCPYKRDDFHAGGSKVSYKEFEAALRGDLNRLG